MLLMCIEKQVHIYEDMYIALNWRLLGSTMYKTR
jgi:hypothetical protein